MKFVQFINSDYPDNIRLGYMEGDDVVDINKYDCNMPHTMLGFLKNGCGCKFSSLKKSNPPVEPKCKVTLLAPIIGMDKVICASHNYTDGVKVAKVDTPKVITVFSKFPSCIIGPNEAVKIRTEVTKEVTWEVELAVVIGQKCSNVKKEEALKFVFGYTIAQDIGAVDWFKNNGGDLLLGKAQDTFCPIGPCIATKDEITDPYNLNLKCSINGVEKQNGNTSNLIHKIENCIERLSTVITLMPGDIFLTGTPAGTGPHQKPPEFLKPGDVIVSQIEKIGTFETKVVEF